MIDGMTAPFEYEVECPRCQQRQLAVEHAEYIHIDAPWEPDPNTRFAIESCKMFYSPLILKQSVDLDENLNEAWKRRSATIIWLSSSEH